LSLSQVDKLLRLAVTCYKTLTLRFRSRFPGGKEGGGARVCVQHSRPRPRWPQMSLQQWISTGGSRLPPVISVVSEAHLGRCRLFDIGRARSSGSREDRHWPIKGDDCWLDFPRSTRHATRPSGFLRHQLRRKKKEGVPVVCVVSDPDLGGPEILRI